MDDDGSIVGIKDDSSKDKVDLKLGNWIQEAFFPKPSGLIQYYFNSDDVLVINISKGINKPYYLREKGQKPLGVYIRIGRSKRKASDDEMLRMIMEAHSYSYEDDIASIREMVLNSICQLLYTFEY